MHDRSPSIPRPLTLEQAEIGQTWLVGSVQAPPHAAEWGQWLEEIGFLSGERVSILARGVPGGDPLVVRVGLSTFALRRAEAACVEVRPLQAAAEAAFDGMLRASVEGAGA